MPGRLDGNAPDGVRLDGRAIDALALDGNVFWDKTGVPVIRSLAVRPARKTIGDTGGSIAVEVSATGATSGRLTESRLADDVARGIIVSPDGSAFNTPQGSSVSFIQPNPEQNARYLLELANTNGVAVATADFLWGRIPTITTWTWGSFHQGQGLAAPDTVLLSWAVTGAVPAASIDIAPSIAFHPGSQQSGRHQLTRDRQRFAGRRETLTLTARNAFGSVSARTTIDWGS